jgi:hypothetical protein
MYFADRQLQQPKAIAALPSGTVTTVPWQLSALDPFRLKRYFASTVVRGNSWFVTDQVFSQVLQTYLNVRSPVCIVTSTGTALPRQ